MPLYNSTGKIILIERTASGVSQSGNEWQKVTLVLEVADYKDTFIKQAFTAFGKVADSILNSFEEGDEVEVAWSLSSREWNGRWYTDASLYKVNQVGASDPAPAPAPRQTRRSPVYDRIEQAQRAESLEPQEEDLPF